MKNTDTQHTAGPWHNAHSLVFTQSGDVVATTILAGRAQLAEYVANASLIAQAPRLLSDLEDLVLACEKALPYGHPALVNARATIAAARG